MWDRATRRYWGVRATIFASIGVIFISLLPTRKGGVCAFAKALETFVKTGALPQSDDMEMPLMPRDGAAELAVVLPMGKVGEQPVKRHVLLAYTEGYAIEYLGRKLRPYWQRNGLSVEQMLSDAESQRGTLEERGQRFDQELTADLEKTGGKQYAQIATLAYRQTLAAHGFAADVDGTPLLFPKENFRTAAFRRWMCCIRRGRFFCSSIQRCLRHS